MSKKKSSIFITVILSIIAAVQLFPLYWLVTYSLKTNAEILGENILGLPKVPQLVNYVKAITSGGILRYFFNSIFYSLICVLAVVLLSTMCGYALSKMKWKLKGIGFAFISIGIMIPASAKLLPLFQILDKIGLKGGFVGLILVYIASEVSFATLILYGFCGGIPDELEEAAVLDGYNIYNMFAKIILPILKPAMATAGIFTFLSVWNEFMYATVFLDNSKYYTLPVGIMSFTGENVTNLGLIGAGLVVATVPALIFYFVFSKQIQSGITDGAVKG